MANRILNGSYHVQVVLGFMCARYKIIEGMSMQWNPGRHHNLIAFTALPDIRTR